MIHFSFHFFAVEKPYLLLRRFFRVEKHLLPLALGVEGVLWTGPVADGLAFIMSLVLLLYERHHLKKRHAARLAAQAQ